MTGWSIRGSIGGIACAVCLGALFAQNVPAPDPILHNAPIVPFSLASRKIPQFFWELLGNDAPYSSIVALIDSQGDNPWYEVILRERGSGKQIYYCNSQATISALVDDGEDAFFTPIDVDTSSGTSPALRLQFHDNDQRTIRWTFVASSEEDQSASVNGFIPRPDDFGSVLLRADHARKAAPSSTISVGGEQNVARDVGFYASQVLLVKIQPVTQQWNVVSVPGELLAGSRWTLGNINAREEVITIERVDGDQILLNVQNTLGPNSPATRLSVLRTADQFVLRWLAMVSDPRAFQISFDPPLPLPAAQANDKTLVRFTINAGGLDNAASGSISAMRGFRDEHLNWAFQSPDWAKAIRFGTGVTTLSGTLQVPRKY